MLASVVSNPKLHTYVAINARYRSLTYFIVHAIYFVGAGEIHSVARVQAVDYVVSVACSAVSVPISACLPFPCTYCSDALTVAPFALDVKKARDFPVWLSVNMFRWGTVMSGPDRRGATCGAMTSGVRR